MAKKASKPKGRFSEVRSTLKSIQGNKVPDYQGMGAFWMDYKTLLNAKLYGNRLIADLNQVESDKLAGSGTCCGSTESRSGSCWPSGGGRQNGDDTNDTSRSDQSALIIGLKGQAPFDGSIFPKLLWDAKRDATEAEIAIIARWIDDGCPDDDADVLDKMHEKQVATSGLLALACGSSKHKTTDQCTNISQAANKGLKVRKEISSMTDREVQRFRDAISCMKTFNDHYQDERSFGFWARIHANSCQHGWEQFLPWHRLYLYFFEQMLQDFDEHITLPYWAWSEYADVNKSTLLDQGILPDRYGCWLDAQGYEILELLSKKKKITLSDKQLKNLSNMATQGTIYQSSARFLKVAEVPFMIEANPENSQAQWTPTIRAIYEQLQRINPLWVPQRWPRGSVAYPRPEDIQRLMQIPNWREFGGGPEYDHHFGSLEQVHNGMHNFAGGTNPYYPNNAKWEKIYKELVITPDEQNPENPPSGMMTDSRMTAFDPIFWAHHGNVDRIWAQWQETNTHAKPEAMDGVLAPWSLTVADAMSTHKLGYEYLRNSYHYKTSRHYAVTRFNSQEAGVDDQILNNFRKAEVRLHRVQRANLPSSVIRIYLNDSSADHSTKMYSNEHFAAELHLFHGTCHGGPGHCNLPLDKSRQFDKRTLNHNEPRNYRVDVTQVVNRMLAKGETDISVHVVVVGLDGSPLENALYLDGVSLNFMD